MVAYIMIVILFHLTGMFIAMTGFWGDSYIETKKEFWISIFVPLGGCYIIFKRDIIEGLPKLKKFYNSLE